MACLEQWAYTCTAKDGKPPRLRGYLFGDELIPDGDEVVTAPLVQIDLEQSCALTQDALYTLGVSRSENAWEQKAMRKGKRLLVRLSVWRFLFLPLRLESARKYAFKWRR